MTLSELKTLIQNYVESTETTLVNTLDDIIKNAEERIFEDIQFDFFRKNVSGSLSIGNRFLTCPSDFILPFSLAVINTNGDYTFLDKKHPTFMQEYVEDPADSTLRGLPLYYGQFDKELSTGSDNGSTLIVAPVPDAAYNVELSYLYKPTSLVTNTTGTWLSTNAKNGLLYASIMEAYTFLKGEPDLLQLYESRYQAEISRLKNRAEARSRQDEYRYDALRKPIT
jgi:hypothetical protein